MKISLIAIGKMKNGPERDLAGRYADRIAKAGPPLGLELDRIIEISESRAQDGAGRKREEADAIGKAVPPGSVLIAMDERGKNLTSRDFADLVGTLRDGGSRHICLIVGGPDGLDETLRASTDHLLSFGRMTWPHQLVRILVSEQLYRAVTILAGHPYHRD